MNINNSRSFLMNELFFANAVQLNSINEPESLEPPLGESLEDNSDNDSCSKVNKD